MLGPYRDPVTVDAPLLPEPLPDRCITAPEGCSHRPPPAAAPAIRPGPALPPLFAKALSASATLLLLSATAFFATGTWITASAYTSARAIQAKAPAPAGNEQMASRPAPRPRAPVAKRAVPAPPGPRPVPLDGSPGWSMLAGMGRQTHDVETLWQRAGTTGAYTMARASVARGAVTPDDPLTWIREQGGGLRVTNVDPPWPKSLFGFHRGDRIVAVNGFALRGPGDVAFAKVALGGNALVELIRDGKLVALRIDWVP